MSNSEGGSASKSRPGSILSRIRRGSGASFWTQLANKLEFEIKEEYEFYKNFHFSKNIVKKLRRNRRLMRQRAMEAMTGDSHIDRVSRVMFPLTFFLFNVVYWFAYLSVSEIEYYWEQFFSGKAINF
jgi:hypothetical protein